jgi:gamma-glutamyltranspeptidase / glutathione hydrolase
MAVSRDSHHPLMYLYTPLSWLSCRFPIVVCNTLESSTSMSSVSGDEGMVVTTQHEASTVGRQILRLGGTAVDAAVAVGYALAVTDPCCGNLGGGGFMTIRFANGKSIFLNFREKAPLSATRTMYLDSQGNVIRQNSTTGFLAVAVPGTVKGLNYVLSKYGTMSRQQVMAPSVKLAEEGFVLKDGDIRVLNTATNSFREQANVASIFLKNGKDQYRVGDRLIQADLARTLKLISTEGSDVFYKGKIADEVVQASRTNGGILTKADFVNYAISETQPLQCRYRDYEILTAPLPGGGVTLCQMLNIVEGYPLKKLGRNTKESLHLKLSSMLLAYADRSKYLGDPDFVKSPIEKLVSKTYAAQLRSKIPQDKALSPEQFYAGISAPNEGTNTTHFSVVDRLGNAVSITYTLNSNFGAKIIAGKTGFFLNNEMDDFAVKPGTPNQFGLIQGSANAISPGKRPLSSMTPTIVTKNKQLFIVTGSPGGAMIPTTLLQVLTNVIDYEMPLEMAINTPRFHYQGLPNFVITEPFSLEPQVVRELWDMKYRVVPFITWGAAESVVFDPKSRLLKGVNDARKSAGLASGY